MPHVDLFVLEHFITCTLVPATKTGSPQCSKCGIIRKSGKKSCCARGGSWFQICGTADSTKVEHTWVEGVQACKARVQSEVVLGQQVHGDQRKRHDPSNEADMAIQLEATIHPKAVISSLNTSASTSLSRSAIPALIHAGKSSINNTVITNAKAFGQVVMPAFFISAKLSTPVSTISSINTSSITNMRLTIAKPSSNMAMRDSYYFSTSTSIRINLDIYQTPFSYISCFLIMIS